MSNRNDLAQLSSLDGIRAHFDERQRELGKGFHALGEEVFASYWQAAGDVPKPVSAMTFRNFLQGKTTLRDPTGLELYFLALGATPLEMKVIRATLRQALDRKLVQPRQSNALRGMDEQGLDSLPYSRALVECEIVTRLEDSVTAVVSHLTPREYLLGPDGNREPAADPERWGLIQHLEDLQRRLAELDQRLIEGLESIPRRAHKRRTQRAAADLREVATTYAFWLVDHPRAGDLMFSRRRYMLHGYFPEAERALALALSRRIARLMFGFLERFALELLSQDASAQRALRTPTGENALEVVAERALSVVHTFYTTVVQGSLGTGAFFRGHYQLRRENAGSTGDWTAAHDALLTSYESTVRTANKRLEEDVRVPYRVLCELYEHQYREAREPMLAIWQRDYAAPIPRQVVSLLLSELHACGVLSDKQLLEKTRELCSQRAQAELWGSEGRER